MECSFFMPTSSFCVFGLEPFPHVVEGDDVVAAILASASGTTQLRDGDILVLASKIVSLEEGRRVRLDGVVPSREARELAERTGKDPRLLQLVIEESRSYRLAKPAGPVLAFHRLGYELTSAGVDRDTQETAVLLPVDPDASAERIRVAIRERANIRTAVIIADSDGRGDRRGAIVLAVGAAGIGPLRVTFHEGKRQEETLVDLLAGAAGVVLGQRGRGVPVVVLRGVEFEEGNGGMRSLLHHSG